MVLLAVLCVILPAVFAKAWQSSRIQARISKSISARKRPLRIYVISEYGPVSGSFLDSLAKKYGVELFARGECRASDDYRSFLKLLTGADEKISYEEMTRFISENRAIFPDVVILCSDVSVFKTESPYLLYSAETLHYRKAFSEGVLVRALAHYSRCEMRNGK
ncbi:uncharacterized protein NEMAJ01_1910 [Nematocida major]|uniref:uncharacterized protein n=1 Tax=Nematocida major TaxID=1912982 RepID=UPI0020072C1B|nr:uncharacterized protein NEMAJ01_1910 [Nematocida major]KAH9387014.1 hypothetical protein NEMAJ01_1910 [Nematocida major]